jgi:hypothetical protein
VRGEILDGIRPTREAALENHELLRRIFERELEFRLSNEPDPEDRFEQIYQCALLLYLIGDVSDASQMWKAKGSGDMDLGIGFDVQFLVGAGVAETIAHYRQNGETKAVEWLQGCEQHGDFDYLEEWEEHQIQYHYRPANDAV